MGKRTGLKMWVEWQGASEKGKCDASCAQLNTVGLQRLITS